MVNVIKHNSETDDCLNKGMNTDPNEGIDPMDVGKVVVTGPENTMLH